MKLIKHKTRNITISGDAIVTTQNTVNYTITTDIDNYAYTLSLFTYMNGSSQYINNNFIYSNSKHIPNLPDIMSTNTIQTEDVGLSGEEITKNFATSILFNTNVLELDLNDFELE